MKNRRLTTFFMYIYNFWSFTTIIGAIIIYNMLCIMVDIYMQVIQYMVEG